MPIFFQFVIDRLGYKWTLRISALITAAVAVSPGRPLAQQLVQLVRHDSQCLSVLGPRHTFCEPSYPARLDGTHQADADASVAEHVPPSRILWVLPLYPPPSFWLLVSRPLAANTSVTCLTLLTPLTPLSSAMSDCSSRDSQIHSTQLQAPAFYRHSTSPASSPSSYGASSQMCVVSLPLMISLISLARIDRARAGKGG